MPYLRGYRADALPLRRHAALRPAGGARQRPAGLHGRARHPARRARRLRLGRARGLHRRGAVARARACLVTLHGYNIQNIAASAKPAPPEQEHRFWYQYYFHTERGRAGLEANRRELAASLAPVVTELALRRRDLRRSAASFDNPDFVAVVIQSYRHRFGYAPGDPALEPIEQQLAAQPRIAVPTIALQGAATPSVRPRCRKAMGGISPDRTSGGDPAGRPQPAAGSAGRLGGGGAGVGCARLVGWVELFEAGQELRDRLD